MQQLTNKTLAAIKTSSIARGYDTQSCYMVWCKDLIVPTACADRYARYLDPGERDRATKFVYHRDRTNFITRRFLLRCLLARLLDVSATDIIYDTGIAGKLSLGAARDSAQLSWHFNTSHAGGATVIALCRHGEVGVDIEPLKHNPAHKLMLPDICTPAEQQWVSRAPHDRAFSDRLLRLWTAKEAILKYLGAGLLIPMREIEISVSGRFSEVVPHAAAPPESAPPESTAPDASSPCGLRLQSVVPIADDTISEIHARTGRVIWPPILQSFTLSKEIFGQLDHWRPDSDADHQRDIAPIWSGCLAAEREARIQHLRLSDPVGFLAPCLEAGSPNA